MSANNPVVSREEWLKHRLDLLKKEKALTRQRDELSHQRRELPWVLIDKDYRFFDNHGEHSMLSMFEGQRQLVFYHFMFGADWDAGCSSCSFWADNFNGIDCHLANRDVSFAVVSSADADTLERYKNRMGWNFRWVSAPDFNQDFYVSFNNDAKDKGSIYYNFSDQNFFMQELPGVSVFIKDDNNIYHTYSTYSRGVDLLNSAYNFLDLTPLGRNEDNGLSWVRRHDEY